MFYCTVCIGDINLKNCSQIVNLCESQSTCKPNDISPSKQCDYIRCCCIDTIGDGFIDYLSFVYCDYNEYKLLTITILIIGVIYSFLILALISDGYFAVLMEELTKYFNLPYNVAGVTFLAWYPLYWH